MLSRITPLVLTYNEAPNIARCLERLRWAPEVVVVDSHSADGTPSICARFPNVRVVQRPFDCHANQWNFALSEADKSRKWVLALDADYYLTDDFIKDLRALSPDQDTAGYWCRFKHAIFGQVLRCGIYPPSVALFRRDRGRYVQDGHTQRAVVDGKLGSIAAPIIHDDRKPLERWVSSQGAYARLEAQKIAGGPDVRLGFHNWLRAATPLAPLAMAAYCLFVRGGIFDGRTGWYYALQRMAAEALISASILDAQLRRASSMAAGAIDEGESDADSRPERLPR